MLLLTILPIMLGLGLVAFLVVQLRSRSGSGPSAVSVEQLQFETARDVLKYMQEQRIGYISVEGRGKWEAKDLRQQGIVNILREKYLALQEAQQRGYYEHVADDYTAQVRQLIASRPHNGLAGYRQQLMKLKIYIRDAQCLAEIDAELEAIMPLLQDGGQISG
jgi:hypothetical protein